MAQSRCATSARMHFIVAEMMTEISVYTCFSFFERRDLTRFSLTSGSVTKQNPLKYISQSPLFPTRRLYNGVGGMCLPILLLESRDCCAAHGLLRSVVLEETNVASPAIAKRTVNDTCDAVRNFSTRFVFSHLLLS